MGKQPNMMVSRRDVGFGARGHTFGLMRGFAQARAKSWAHVGGRVCICVREGVFG